MRAGNLDRLITVQERTVDTSDPYGGVSYTWSDLATLRAELLEGRAEEFLRGDMGETAEGLRIFRVRYHPDVTTDHRVVYGGEPHDIEQLTEIGRRRGLELRCRRRTGDQGA